jgi:hypothetical protein
MPTDELLLCLLLYSPLSPLVARRLMALAFDAEVGRNLRKLQGLMQILAHRPHKLWQPWLTHAATAASASSLIGLWLMRW